MTDYHINIFFSEEDGRYVADLPSPRVGLRCDYIQAS